MIGVRYYRSNMEIYRDNRLIATLHTDGDSLMCWRPPSAYPDSPFDSCDEAVADYMSDLLDDPKFDLKPPLTDDEKYELLAAVKQGIDWALCDEWSEWEEATT